MKRSLWLVLVPMLLTGCATLNRSECHTANWRMIGMEDGARGVPVSYIGKHRTACAKHNVTPDFEDYRRGHDEGVRQFCTKNTGFDMGRKGHLYNNVCPPDLEDAFLESYNMGKELHSRQFELDRAADDIQSDRRKIEKLDDEIKEKKERLIKASTESQRAGLLNEVEELQDQRKNIEKKLYRDQRSYEQQKRAFETFQDDINY